MKKTAVLGIALIVTPLLSLAQGFASPAEADSWFVGGGFKVGGAHFSLAFDSHRRHHAPYYYYRTSHSLRYDGYRCGSYCFKDARSVYHHPGCPLVQHHFLRHGFHPARIWQGVRVPPGFPYYGTWRHPGYDAYRGRPYHPDYYGRGHDDYRGRGWDHRYDDDHRGRGRGRGHHHDD